MACMHVLVCVRSVCVIARWAEPTVATSPRPGLVLSRLLGRSPLPRGEIKRRAPREEDGVSLQPEHEHAHTHTLVADKSMGLKGRKITLANKDISFLRP